MIFNKNPNAAAHRWLDRLVAFVENHPQLFVLTGAGCSTGSGIPDYRDVHGAWKRPQPIRYQQFVSSQHSRKRYWMRSFLGWPRFASAAPNIAHQALARLEVAGCISQLITQNIDGLHQKAGSERVIDLHGRLDRIVCLHCQYQGGRAPFQTLLERLNPAMVGLSAPIGPDGDVDFDAIDFNGFEIPACPQCGGILKPDVVFFGEAVPKQRVETAMQALAQADALLVVGSSLTVWSGYRFCQAAIANGQAMAAINLGCTRADAEWTLKVDLDCGHALWSLLERLGIADFASASLPFPSSINAYSDFKPSAAS